MRYVILLMLLTSFASKSVADDAEGKIIELWGSPTAGYIMFSVSDPSHQPHRCNSSGRFSIDLRGPGGNATYELLLLAKAENLNIYVKSLNTCNPFDAENVRYVIVR